MELLETAQILQPRIGHLGSIEVQVLEVLELLQVGESAVADLCEFQVQAREMRQRRDVRQVSVFDGGSREIQPGDLSPDRVEALEAAGKEPFLGIAQVDSKQGLILADRDHARSGAP